jgi:flavodoxin
MILLLSCILLFGSCGGGNPPAPDNEENKMGKILIAYFTRIENIEKGTVSDRPSSNERNLKGNTKAIAVEIQKLVGGELFSIQTKIKYPYDYTEQINLAQKEKDEKARPELATKIQNLDNYDAIFVGFPNWWGDMPMALYTFFESYDFSGKTIIPFCTHGGSGLSQTVSAIKSLEPNATVLEGVAIYRDNVGKNATADIQTWLTKLGITKKNDLKRTEK